MMGFESSNYFDRIHSYNTGYNRGLNTEYHDKELYLVFLEWLEIQYLDNKQVEVPFFSEFKKGFECGIDSYREFK